MGYNAYGYVYFLDKFNLSGKTIMPFCTHEGSGMGSSESDIKKLCPNADVKRVYLFMVQKQVSQKAYLNDGLSNIL